MICQHCGNPLPKGAKFCSICGQPQAQLTCNNCGNPLEPNTSFCSNCGTPVTNTITTPESVRTQPPQKTNTVYDWDPFELNELDTLTFVLTKKYTEFQGRASRSEFFRYNLMISLCLTIIPIIMGIIKLVSNNIMTVIVLYVLLGIIELALILPGFNPINNTTPTHYSTNTNSNNSSVKATPSPQPTSTNTQSVAQNNAVEESTKALQNYYRYLTNKDFANAYTYLSDEQRASLGTYDYWRNGYKSTLSTTLLSTKAVSVSPDAVVYNYRIESKDLVNGRIKHQTFTGNVTMVKNNNNWIIQDQDGQLADSYYE